MAVELKQLSNENLITQLKDLVRRERELLNRLLHFLREVERRRLYAQKGYDSLFAYMREELGYSEASADRRIKAMRLIRDLPEVEEKIATGSLSLSVAATVQRFLQKENRKRKTEQALPFTKTAKLELVNALEGRSLRDCEQKLAEISPEAALPRDRTRVLTQEKVHIAFTASLGLLQKIERLKVLTCHQNPQGQYEALFERAVDLALDKLDPERKVQRALAKAARRGSSQRQASPSPQGRVQADFQVGPGTSEERTPALPKTPAPESQTKNQVLEKSDQRKKNRNGNEGRYIPQEVRRQVWIRDQGRCQHRDPRSGKVCNSQYLLEIDHRFPFSLGGSHTPENLRLLCRVHNQYRAERLFGIPPPEAARNGR